MEFMSSIIAIGNTDFKVTFRGTDSFDDNEWYSKPHRHPFAEMHLVNQGRALIKISTGKILLSDNHICIIPAKCYHSPKSITSKLSRMSFYIEIEKNADSGDDTYSVYKSIFEAKMPFYKECKSSYLKDIFELDKSAGFFGITNNKFEFLLSLLLCEIYDANTSGAFANEESKSIDSKANLLIKFEKYLNFIPENGNGENTDFIFNKIASELYLSPSQLRRLIKKHFNCTYRELLVECKMERAKILIDDSDITLENVAELCGYSTYAGFYKAFTKYTGTTPDKYRSDN